MVMAPGRYFCTLYTTLSKGERIYIRRYLGTGHRICPARLAASEGVPPALLCSVFPVFFFFSLFVPAGIGVCSQTPTQRRIPPPKKKKRKEKKKGDSARGTTRQDRFLT
jgi:hypothetical protein